MCWLPHASWWRMIPQHLLRFLILCAAFTFLPRDVKSDTDFDKLASDVFRFELKEFPHFATSYEFHEHDAELSNFTLTAYKERKKAVNKFLQRANALTEQTSRDWRLLEYMLSEFKKGYAYREYLALNPISFIEGDHLGFALLMGQMKHSTEQDFRVMLKRLGHLPKSIDQQMELMERAIELGRTNHNLSIVEVINQTQVLFVPANQTAFYKPFKTKPPGIDTATWENITTTAEDIIENKVLPAFEDLQDFIENDYLPHTRSKEGVHVWGDSFYDACLCWHTSTNKSASDIHQIGLDEVKRIEGLMEAAIQRLEPGYQGSIADYFEQLRGNTSFFYSTEDDLLKGYRDIYKDEIEPKMTQVVHSVPNNTLEIRKMEASNLGGWYESATKNRPGVFYANVEDPGTRPKFVMRALLLHETMPGHHMQAVFVLENDDVPDFRKYTDHSNYFMAPFHFPFHTALVEGWALYGEYLGEELNIYKDDYDLLGRYSMEMLRAVRLVVDTGIHHKKWNFTSAVDYMANRVSMSHDAVRDEIRRYMTWPGQACAYKIGEIKLKELRKRAEDALGSQFNMKDFHKELLRLAGGAPLSIVEEVIDEYIADANKR